MDVPTAGYWRRPAPYYDLIGLRCPVLVTAPATTEHLERIALWLDADRVGPITSTSALALP